jgi:hypothetical protein
MNSSTAKMWRIYFETGDDMLTSDAELANIHREKGRIVVEVEEPATTVDQETNRA